MREMDVNVIEIRYNKNSSILLVGERKKQHPNLNLI
jgi:hypothetical protein